MAGGTSSGTGSFTLSLSSDTTCEEVHVLLTQIHILVRIYECVSAGTELCKLFLLVC